MAGAHRRQLDRFFQLYQAQLAEMATMITNSQLMLPHWPVEDDGKLTPVQSACTSVTTLMSRVKSRR